MMSTERVFSLKNVWFTASVGAVLGIVAVAAVIGFIWIPSAQSNNTITGLWDAICTAAGVPESLRQVQPPTTPIARTSNVIVSAQMMNPADSLSIARGARLAMQCTICHGVLGMSHADAPNLAGQYDAAIYKQLRDFKSGHRTSAIMGALAANLSDQDMRDLAAYFAGLPREREAAAADEQHEAPVIVRNGSPMRNIAGCTSCHGGIDIKTGSPRLDGESESYLRTQLHAFATGARHNDIYGQMRNVARQMTPAEIDTAARYYAGR
jgi:cytochrome c553